MQVKYSADEVLVACGGRTDLFVCGCREPEILAGKQAIYQVVMALCQKGDEVIVPAPYWTSYPAAWRLEPSLTCHAP